MDKLDAAIGWLRMGVDFHEESHYDRDSCHAAILVLEAAAKVDREWAITWLEVAIAKRDKEYPNSTGTFSGQIMSLLEALPDDQQES